MKIRKNSKQGNFTIDERFYSGFELRELLEERIIDTLFNRTVIYKKNCKEIKIVCKDGYYYPVVITNDDRQFYVKLY